MVESLDTKASLSLKAVY